MIDKLAKIECCGCNVCGDACPKGAITFFEDNEGFCILQLTTIYVSNVIFVRKYALL